MMECSDIRHSQDFRVDILIMNFWVILTGSALDHVSRTPSPREVSLTSRTIMNPLADSVACGVKQDTQN